MNEHSQTTLSDFWPVLALLLVSIAISIGFCMPFLKAPLVSDDWVLLDALVRNGIWGAWGGGGHEMLGFFRPLMTLTLWINMRIGGFNPLGYHLINAIIHGVAAWLVLLIIIQLAPDKDARNRSTFLIGIGACFLFLVHPSHGEPVAWVSSRPDLMACAFTLGSLAVWIKRESKQTSGPSVLKQVLAGVLFVLGLLAKESAFVLPLIVFAFELIVGSRGKISARILNAIRRTWPLFLILLLFLIVRAAALGHAIGGYGSGRILAVNPVFWARNLVVATIRSLLPAIPSPGFDDRARIGYAAVIILIAAFVAISLTVKIYKSRDHSFTMILFCLAAFVISILPVINLPVSLRSSEGERFIYLPSAFMVMALAMVIRENCKITANIANLAGLIFCLYVIGFDRSLTVWGDAGRLAGNLAGDLNRIVDSRTITRMEVFNLPDHLRGAYVFRNGFVEAARLNGITPERIKEIKIQNVQPIQDTNESFKAPIVPASPGIVYVNYSEGKLKEISR